MTPDDPEDDRTVIRPPGQTAMPKTAAFQATEWSAGPGAAAMDKTRSAAAPAPHQDGGSGLPIGTYLGEFELTQYVAEGGFGIVYLAYDHSLQRRVALKEYMPSSLASRASGSQVSVKSERHRETFAAGLKSFINEARLLASFDHPSLLKVYRFWEANGTAYMVMPFLEGTTLKDRLRQLGQPPDEEWLRGVLGPLTEALLVIHAEQCYHRDIAPDNIMLLAGSNRALLMDFGASRRVIGDMTQALTVILKPGYAPVEQYAEIPGMKQGPWTDVYALAAVVYFAIMGKTPPTSVGRLLNDTYVPLVQAAAGRYSEGFLAAIDRALAVRPEERTQTIGQLRMELGLAEALPAEPYTTRPMPPGTPMPARSGEPTQALAGERPRASATPPPAPRVNPPAAPVTGAAAPAQGGGKGAMLGLGAGVVVLAALGVGVYVMMSPSPAPAPAPEPVRAAAPAAPAPAVEAAPALPPPVAAFDAGREFDRLVQGQTAGFNVRAEAVKTELSIARKDEIKFRVTSERDGHLYVFGLGTDGMLALLVPNRRSGPVKLQKGKTWSFPTADGFYLPADEPVGASRLVIMMSAEPRRFDSLKPTPQDPIQLLPTGAEATALAAQHKGPLPLLAGQAQCAGQPGCADDYGAAELRFNTVR